MRQHQALRESCCSARIGQGLDFDRVRDAWRFGTSAGRLEQIRLDAPIVFGHLLRPGVLRAERVENGRGGDTTNGALRRPVQELAWSQPAVHISVEEAKQIGVES